MAPDRTDALPAGNLPRRSAGGRLQLLAETRVLDLTTSLAGPYASLLLADLGADIIKIERPGVGDDARHWRPPTLGGEALWFLSINRNKRSIGLDYSKPEGALVLHDLVRSADVVISNELPRVQGKLGIGYAELAKIRPDLVYVSLTGFGLQGARANLPCYDLIAEGYSGVMDLTGEAGGDPQKVGTPAADLLAGMDAALGCLAALLDRSRTGNGHLVDVSLVESMTRFMTPRLVSYLGSGDLPHRSGAKDSVIAIYQVFATLDAPITLGLANDAIWRRFCEATGRADWLEDAALKDNAGRVGRRSELVGKIGALLQERPRSEWLALFGRFGVPAGPINTLAEVSVDPELHRSGLLYALETRLGQVPQVRLGIKFDEQSAGYDFAPPGLGEHSTQILGELLNYPASRIAELQEKGLVQ
ncbi:CaiB/BaiF CoA transferase family protein [Bradyrhizobium tropiciagri]|uniref:CaiB/BaiF CoA transferase family protein n=1 Tax=Bradyrhizobium tropiciagri TaxID=312253 RepID=UPI00067DD510|nr:CoA transferase [Bradyrhizobium tropiciagri]